MKLNVGCGRDIREGYVNLDFRDIEGVNIVCDMLKEDIPLDDNSVDEILAKDILEHFMLADTDMILKKWYRVLRPKGWLQIEVPNTMLNVGEFLAGTTKCAKGQDIAERFSQIMYGKQDYPGNCHYQLFDEKRLQDVCEKAGFIHIKTWTYGRALCVQVKK